MEAPNRDDFRAAFARRLHNISRSLEILARAGRGHLDPDVMQSVWRAQLELHRAGGPQPWPKIPDEI